MIARTIRCFAFLLALSLGAPAAAQELVISTALGPVFGGPGPLVVIGDLAHDLPVPAPFYVAPIGPYPVEAINPHGLALLSRDKAVVTHVAKNFVEIFDLPSASLEGWFYPGGVNDTTYTGYGSAALAPDGAYLLLASGSPNVAADRTKLFVVPTPLSSTSIASDIIALPGDFGTAQTHGIVFDPQSRRAYVGHTNGITAIDPPYAAANVAFTIPLPAIIDSHHVLSYSVELSPDASTLLAAGQQDGTLRILHAPFSAGSTYQTLTIAGAQGLDGISITPDGSQALVVDSPAPPKVFAVAAPFSATSAVETMSLASLGSIGFEDLAISPDGQFAALTGNGIDPLIVLRAPFTEAGVTAYAVPFLNLGPPYGPVGRGAGTVRFWSEPATLPPQVRINRIWVNEGDSGMSPATFTVTLSRPSAQAASVDYATMNGSAQAGIHYQATSGTLAFPPGAVQRTISVPIIGNTLNEGTRNFKVNLSSGVNAVVLQEPGYYGAKVDGLCFIVEDDTAYIASEPPLPDATVGVPYAFQFTAENFTSAVIWSIRMGNYEGPPPAGLSLDSTTGVLSGVPTTPTIAGDFSSGYFVVHAQGSPAAVGREYHLTVRSDVIFANGFDAAGGAQPAVPALMMRTMPPATGFDAGFDPGMAAPPVHGVPEQ